MNIQVELPASEREKFEKSLHNASKDIIQKCAGSLYRSAERIMRISKDTFVPVDTGALQSSGNVSLPVITESSIEVVLSYGNESVDYAISVHETDKHYRNGKQWKYLETPLKDSLNEIMDRLKEEVR